ncbi:MAG: response regulator [Desulfuromonadales bacterium]|nr:response regulator [Desulfuromonadales bacterium]
MDKKKKILLADDAKLFLEIEKTFLQRTSVEILTASDGRQALQLARQHHPNVAFLDLNMPEMDGDECCRAIKQDPELKDTTVVMVTTKGRTQDQKRCREAGCDEVLLKPINRTEFLATVEKYLQIPSRSKRYKVKSQVKYGENVETSLTGFSIDISSGGLYISTENTLDVGVPLVIRFSLEGSAREIVCKCQVAWINSLPNLKRSDLPPGMGIQFVGLSLEDLHTIRNFIENKQLEPSWQY